MKAGAPGRAIQLAQPLFSAANPRIQGTALRIAAEALHALDRTPTALQALQAALQLQPQDPQIWRVAADVFAALGDVAQSERALDMRVRLRPGDIDAWAVLAEHRAERDDLAGAIEALSAAILRAPRRVDLVQKRIELLLDLGALGALNRAVHQALACFPRHPELRLLASQTCFHRSDMDAAVAHLDEALGVDPGHIRARTTRASYRLMSRSYEDALADVDLVLSRFPSDPTALEVRARVHLAQGDPQSACDDLDRVLSQAELLPAELQGTTHLRRGAAREALGDHAGALKDYVDGQGHMATVRRFRVVNSDGYLDEVRARLQALVAGGPLVTAAAEWPSKPAPDAPLAHCPPVFMFGFPRSGTTLMERVLGGHPALVPTDESNLLGHVVDAVDRMFERRPAHLLTDAEVLVLRGIFARQAVKHGADPDTGLRAIDKLPLNFVHIALVRRVFPDAPVIFVVRDPRDCVWSAFVQSFSPNAAMVRTTSLQGTAEVYDATLQVWLRAKQTLPGLSYTELRYEAVVADVEAGARQLAGAAGVPFDPAMLDYRARLSGQFVRTPSAAAVARPVSRTRVGRWQHFRAGVAPILPVLAPYVAHFGYIP